MFHKNLIDALEVEGFEIKPLENLGKIIVDQKRDFFITVLDEDELLNEMNDFNLDDYLRTYFLCYKKNIKSYSEIIKNGNSLRESFNRILDKVKDYNGTQEN